MSHAHMDDATLVALTLAGDQSAYEQLVIRHQSAAIAVAARVIGSRYLAEDAVQDAFVTAWMKLDTLDQPEKFGVWVCRIARNCALNMRSRIRDTLPEETLEQIPEDYASPENVLIRSEDNRLLYEGIAKLPEKIAETIRLHYFHGLSVADIAARLGISEGGVKWRLHKGRQGLKEDLAAMNENDNNTLVQRVMNKVEELKAWMRNPHSRGIKDLEAFYEDVLSEVKKLPESTDKYNVMADVLDRGYRWIPDQRSDDRFAAMWDAAIKGRNEEIMKNVIRMDFHHPKTAETIRDRRIPAIEAMGLTKTLGWAWFQLGKAYHGADDHEAGFAAFEKAKAVLPPSDVSYAATLASEKMEKERLIIEKVLDERRRYFFAAGYEYRYINGELRLCEHEENRAASMMRGDVGYPDIWKNASDCDGRFFFPAKEVGENIPGAHGYKLIYGGGGHTVVTPAGTFEDCVLWTVWEFQRRYETYYKDGVGIVRQDIVYEKLRKVYHLSGYVLDGGSGLLPICAGNRWSYVLNRDPAYLDEQADIEIIHADGESAVITSNYHKLRYGYDPDNWRDMAVALRNLYGRWDSDGKWRHEDVRPYMVRMKALAKTPYEIAHTKAACSVMERILASDPELNPDRTQEGLFNHFSNRTVVKNEDGSINMDNDWLMAFADWEEAITPVAVRCSSCYGILQQALGCQNYDELAKGIDRTVTVQGFVEVELIVRKAGTVTTPAGSFENCLEFALNIPDLHAKALEEVGGKKEYYFAPGVGIVKAVHYFDNEPDCIYELCEYEGIGEGYFPQEDGFRRFYRAIGLPDGYRASAEYTVAADESGDLWLLVDLMGMRKIK